MIIYIFFCLSQAVIEESLVKHVFGGVLRSSVHQKGKKESTTLQPFFTLQLDIQVCLTKHYGFVVFFFFFRISKDKLIIQDDLFNMNCYQ